MKPRVKLDIQALCFFVETVCHLNPTKMAQETCREYQDCVDRVREEISKQEIEA